jgi:predicted PurR-regulated permease PerM
MKQRLKMTPSQKKALAVATAIALLFGAYFLRHYCTLIIFAAILAFLFNPVYQKLLKKGRGPGAASALTFLIAAVAILIPTILILILTGLQINHLVHSVSHSVSSIDLTKFTQRLIDTANDTLAKTPITFRVTAEWLRTTSVDLVQNAGVVVLNGIKSYASGFFSFFTTAIIFIFVFLSLLKNQDTILETARNINPLGPRISDVYTKRISAMTKAMVRGQFIIAVAQGAVDASLIYLAGLHEAFFFLLLILVALSFIPLGGGVLAIPIGIIMILTGNFVGGVIVIAGHLLIVTNVDNILRPRLVPPEAKLDSALMILSVFSGIALLGFLGIVVGPVIMITIVTTISVYLEGNRIQGLPHQKKPVR